MTEFVEPGIMTAPGKYAEMIAPLPADPGGVARVVQGLLIHEFWAGAYGVTLAEPDRDRVNLRRVEQVLDAVVSADDRPLDVAREPSGRISSNCRGFTVLAVTILRAHGVPARARCGFGAYFNPGRYEDHWVVEFHDGNRWRLLDAQLDQLQRDQIHFPYDATDVPYDGFVIAHEAWRRVRAGDDAGKYGLSPIGEAGDWWIAGNMTRDAAALIDIETLPWDTWGAMPGPDDTVDVALFDELAAATAGPSMPDVRRLMTDPRLRVPEQVFNVQHRTLEAL
jgi:hypothetical protein